MGKKRKRRNKIERKGEVHWVRRWRSVVREGKEEVLGVADGLCAGRWSEVMEEERGYAAGGCNSEARQKKMGEKEEEGVQAGGGAGEEDEEDERNEGREGGWRCKWRWVLQVKR
ncbi:hypothetical protein AAC387_Pa05g1462 [Persea americana]